MEVNGGAQPSSAFGRFRVVDRERLANIDTVSGATVTSDGYIQSLQAALDAAHLS